MEFDPKKYLDESYSDKATAIMSICRRLESAPNSKWTAADFTTAARFIVELARQAGFGIDVNVISYIPDQKNYIDLVRKVEADVYATRLPDDVETVLSAIEERTSIKVFGYAYLSGEEKRIIHKHLSAIRTKIEASKLDDRKRNAIMERLNRLAEEVDKSGTGTDRFFAFMGDLAFVIGQMKENAKPALDEFKEVIKILMKNRAKQEDVSLPSTDEYPRLPTPDELRETD